MRLRFSFALGSALALVSPRLPHCAEPKWKEGAFGHSSQAEPLRNLLADFAASQGMQAIVSGRITEKVSGRFEDQNPRRFVEKLSAAYGLTWYYDGAALFFYRAGESRTRIIPLQFMPWNKVIASLKENGVWEGRFPIRPARGGSSVQVTGPPRYVELVAEAAEQLESRAMETATAGSGDNVVKVLPLRHAWAGDLAFTVGDKEVIVPGVATLLSGLAGKEGHGGAKGSGGLSVEQLPALGLRDGAAPFGQPPTGPRPIQADVRTNSVIIKDTRENVQRYQAVAAALDAPSGMVEINASIIDVSSASTRDLGVEWQMRQTGTFQGDNASIVHGQTFSDIGTGAPAIPPALDGYTFSTMTSAARHVFLARIRALEQEGKAKLAARPAVLTFDNLQALIGRTQTFYVRVSGEREANLFRVQSGTVLKVTPHIIEEDETPTIKLAIQIEDGSLSAQETVDGIPVVTESAINTQAMVRDEESLLLGGFLRSEESTVFTKVPFLGSIPLLKYLFSKNTRVVRKMERIFLITPKVVRAPSDAGRRYGLDEEERKEISKSFPAQNGPEPGGGNAP